MGPRRFAVRWAAALLALAAVLTGSPGIAGAAGERPVLRDWPVPKAPAVSAGAAVVMDWQTGEVLYEKDAFRRRDPASTTKVLTALIALERGDLNSLVRVSRRAAYTPGSSMYIKPGEVYSLHDLLYGLLLRSGNDAATAIAEHIAGSVEEFAKLMNARAREIGALNSHFVNPHGLTEPDHYTTAYDLALITREALKNPIFAEIVSMPQATLTYENLNRDVVLHNTNRLLHILPGADGVKTGTTAAAGKCLVASATRDEHKLIAVVLNAGDRWSDSARLLEWGFANFRMTYLGRKGEVLFQAPVRSGMPGQVPVALGSDLFVMHAKGDGPMPYLEVEYTPRLQAPIREGDVLGKAIAKHGSEVKGEALLYAAADVRKRTIWESILQGLQSLRPRLRQDTP